MPERLLSEGEPRGHDFVRRNLCAYGTPDNGVGRVLVPTGPNQAVKHALRYRGVRTGMLRLPFTTGGKSLSSS